MLHPAGEWVISYNGAVFNHNELRRQLPDATFAGTSDTESLLWALERWGAVVLPRLMSQFAIAALDLRDGRLLLARDRFGIKPLYLSAAGSLDPSDRARSLGRPGGPRAENQ